MCVRLGAGRSLPARPATGRCDRAVLQTLESRTLLSAVGSLDQSFGNNGMAVVDFGTEAYAAQVAIQADGKIVAVGGTKTASTPAGDDWSIARLNIDGSLDTSFASDGKMLIDFDGDYDEAFTVLIQSDNKILIGGDVTIDGDQNGAILRLNPDGSRDATFGDNGLVIVNYYSSSDSGRSADTIRQLRFDAQGRIVAAGTAASGTGDQFAVARFNADGSPDLTFGSGGRMTTAFQGTSSNDQVQGMVIGPDGKMVVVGQRAISSQTDWAIMRVNPNGSLDSTFGTGGRVTYDWYGGSDMAWGVALTGGGKILVTGEVTKSGQYAIGLAQFNSNGTFDTSFGGDGTGRVLNDHNPSQPDVPRDVLVQPDGRILVIGRLFNGTSDAGIIRYTAAGVADTSFHPNGETWTDYQGNFDTAEGLALDPAGRIVVAVEAKNSSGHINFIVQRFVSAPPSAAVATGADAGAGPHVKVFARVMGSGPLEQRLSFMAFDPGFSGGVRVAMGDFNGDGIDDVVVAAGPGAGPNVRVFDGASGAPLPGMLGSFFAYDPAFAGGVFVAVGDVNGDGTPDIITGAGPGAGPHVKVFDGTNGAVLKSFYAYDAAFAGGVHVAGGDVNGDGRDDIITGAADAAPHVRAFSGRDDNALLLNFMAFDPATGGRAGVNVTSGDVNGDGKADVAVSRSRAAGPIKYFNGANGQLFSQMVIDPSLYGSGTRLGGVVINGASEFFAAPAPGYMARVDALNDSSLMSQDNFSPYEGFDGGVFVAAGVG